MLSQDLRKPCVVHRALILCLLCALCPCIADGQKREPGLNELVILRPDRNEEGLPPVQYDETTHQVEIPPALHVHRYYYSGDKHYQGPLFEGGPTIVVARHPFTGEKVNIDVMLPAGAPEIVYTKSHIVYSYVDKRVVIGFSRLFPKHIKVATVSGRGFRRRLREGTQRIASRHRNHVASSRLVLSMGKAAQSSKNIVLGAVGGTRSATAFVVDKTTEFVRVVPGVRYLESMGERDTIAREEERIRQASFIKDLGERQFIRTNR